METRVETLQLILETLVELAEKIKKSVSTVERVSTRPVKEGNSAVSVHGRVVIGRC